MGATAGRFSPWIIRHGGQPDGWVGGETGPQKGGPSPVQTRDEPAPPTSLDEIDLVNPDTFLEGRHHAFFRLLRKQAPVFRHPEPDGPGFWALTRYEDVVQVSMDPVTFSSARKGVNIHDVPADGMALLSGMLLYQDPPKHTVYRRIVSKAFTPRVINALEPRVRKMAAGIIAAAAGKGSFDFVSEIAAELPLMVILEMLGVPVEDRRMVFDWSNKMIGFDDPEYAQGNETGREAAAQMFMYANSLAVSRKREPRDDVISTLVRAEVGGQALTETEFDAFFLLLAVAGNETTRNLISGGMLALIEHPEQRRRLLRDPSLVSTAVEEMLRWVSPVVYFRRTVTRDTQIRGVPIPEGDKVVMYYGSANRDEDVFESSETFDIARDPNPHVAFGPGGTHFCLGAGLARLEIRVMFEELLARLPAVELAGPVERLRSNFISGIKRMPVRVA
jgi:cholest-4-en-3-one 26-monooxygenase